jgi:uncharacterized protein
VGESAQRRVRPGLTVCLAFVLWFVTFYCAWGGFWFKIAGSTLLLAGLSFNLRPRPRRFGPLNPKSVLLGLGSAAVLYGVFWAGRRTALLLFPFAGGQIGGIYAKGEGTPAWIVFLLLFCITGPCEEIYWRGYLQQSLMERWGNRRGWLLATAAYALVHISSFNFMLIGAAAVAGAFWGALYWRLRDLTPVMVSHSLWSAVIFTLLPMG